MRYSEKKHKHFWIFSWKFYSENFLENEKKLSTLGSKFSEIDEINIIDFDQSIKSFLIKSKTLLGIVVGFFEGDTDGSLVGDVLGEVVGQLVVGEVVGQLVVGNLLGEVVGQWEGLLDWHKS